MKKIIASFISLCTITSVLSSLLCSAEYEEYIGAHETGALAQIHVHSLGYVVQTDGTVLTEEMLQEIAPTGTLYTWSEYNKYHDAAYYWRETEFSSVEDDASFYILQLDEETREEIDAIGRMLTLELDCIESVYYAEDYSYSNMLMQWAFILTAKDGAALDETSIPELSDFTCEQWGADGASEYTYTFVGDQDTSPLFDKGDYAGTLETSYAVYSIWQEYAQMILDHHADKLQNVKVDADHLLNIFDTKAAATPIWQTAGDHNADGEVNSNDAADLLVQAAQDGVAEASETAVSPDSDVNLDGVADSTDAAYILQYAALKGSGADADWVEILK